MSRSSLVAFSSHLLIKMTTDISLLNSAKTSPNSSSKTIATTEEVVTAEVTVTDAAAMEEATDSTATEETTEATKTEEVVGTDTKEVTETVTTTSTVTITVAPEDNMEEEIASNRSTSFQVVARVMMKDRRDSPVLSTGRKAGISSNHSFRCRRLNPLQLFFTRKGSFLMRVIVKGQ